MQAAAIAVRARRRPPRGGVDRNSPRSGRLASAGASPPARGRGSKRCRHGAVTAMAAVAPRAGAWIETVGSRRRPSAITTVAPRAGAWIETAMPRRARRSQHGRPPRGGVDRNIRRLSAPMPASHVAPRAGAWIETSSACVGRASARGVAPRAGAWIETPADRDGRRDSRVAPRAGAWIETTARLRRLRRRRVAPRAGAWIETQPSAARDAGCASPPARGRGSKHAADAGTVGAQRGRPPRGGVDRNRRRATGRPGGCVAPRAGAWIETSLAAPAVGPATVAPRAGAWIETCLDDRQLRRAAGRPPRGGVDRNSADQCRRRPATRRPPRGGVDRNCCRRSRRAPATQVAPRAGAWIETRAWPPTRHRPMQSPPARGRGSKHRPSQIATALRRPPRGGVDRNMIQASMPGRTAVAPRAGAWIETAARDRSRHADATVAPRAGAWIETLPCARLRMRRDRGRPPCGGVDRNHPRCAGTSRRPQVAPRAGAWIETLRPCDVR